MPCSFYCLLPHPWSIVCVTDLARFHVPQPWEQGGQTWQHSLEEHWGQMAWVGAAAGARKATRVLSPQLRITAVAPGVSSKLPRPPGTSLLALPRR